MHDFSLLYGPFAPSLFLAFVPVILFVILWTVTLKGYALWHAARNSQKEWFIALLIINTFGILELVYLIWFRPDSSASSISSSPAVSSST